MFRLFLISALVLSFNLTNAACAENKEAAQQNDAIARVVETALGKSAKIVRIEEPEKSRIAGFNQIRVWMETVYGETPILFYSTGDGKFYLAGSIYDAEGKNLTKLDVGATRPKAIKETDMELNPDYLIGDKDAPVKAVLWIGPDAYSRQIFDAFDDLYKKNKDKIAIYIKFFPKTEPEAEKMKVLTCFKGEALSKALQTIFDTHPEWGSKEDLDALRKTGDPNACNNDLVFKDIRLAEALKLPPHSVAFVNGVMLIGQPTKENITKLAGTELN